jgi:hypothetical protein
MIEIVIIVGLIFLGWTTPFEVRVNETKTSISSAFDRLGGDLQKNQDPTVRRYQASPAKSR